MKARTAQARDRWKWYGFPGHFCAGRYCAFHLATRLPSGFLVSTLGAYQAPAEDGRPKNNEIGFTITALGLNEDHLYETMVFHCPGEDKDGNPIQGNEIETETYNDSRAAEKGHYALCEAYAPTGPLKAAEHNGDLGHPCVGIVPVDPDAPAICSDISPTPREKVQQTLNRIYDPKTQVATILGVFETLGDQDDWGIERNLPAAIAEIVVTWGRLVITNIRHRACSVDTFIGYPETQGRIQLGSLKRTEGLPATPVEIWA